MRADELALVMPAFNEEANIGRSIDAAVATGKRLEADYEVVIVDDGSLDGTADRVREKSATNPRVRLVSFAKNRGFGAALRTALQSAEKALVFYTDSDLQFDLGEIDKLLRHVGEVPVVVGYRVDRQDSMIRKWNAWAWGRLQWMLFGLDVHDIDCGFKLFRREVIHDLPMRSNGAFISTEILLRLQAAGHGICEVPVHHYPRAAGASTGANPVVIAHAFRELWKLRTELRGR